MPYHPRRIAAWLCLAMALLSLTAAPAVTTGAAPATQATTAEASQPIEPPAGTSMAEAMEVAESALRREDYDEATGRYLWLWDRSLEREPAMYGVRLSFLVSDIKKLVEQHPPARRAFEAKRDALQPSVDDQSTRIAPAVLNDWIALNQIIGDDTSTLEWWDQVKDQLDDAHVRERVQGVTHELHRVLLDDLRWEELARLYPNPLGHVRDRHRFFQMVTKLHDERPLDELPEGMGDEIRRIQQEGALRRFREDVAEVYAALLAADREQEAAEVAEAAANLDESPEGMRLTLVDMALGAGEPRPAHHEWLDHAAEHDSLQARAAEMRSMLENALKSEELRD